MVNTHNDKVLKTTDLCVIICYIFVTRIMLAIHNQMDEFKRKKHIFNLKIALALILTKIKLEYITTKLNGLP